MLSMKLSNPHGSDVTDYYIACYDPYVTFFLTHTVQMELSTNDGPRCGPSHFLTHTVQMELLTDLYSQRKNLSF